MFDSDIVKRCIHSHTMISVASVKHLILKFIVQILFSISFSYVGLSNFNYVTFIPESIQFIVGFVLRTKMHDIYT